MCVTVPSPTCDRRIRRTRSESSKPRALRARDHGPIRRARRMCVICTISWGSQQLVVGSPRDLCPLSTCERSKGGCGSGPSDRPSESDVQRTALEAAILCYRSSPSQKSVCITPYGQQDKPSSPESGDSDLNSGGHLRKSDKSLADEKLVL